MELYNRYPGDLNFQRASSFSKTYQGLSSELTSPICRQAADSFQTKLESIRSTGIMPVEIVHWASYLGKIKGYALAKKSMDFEDEIKSNQSAMDMAEELYSKHLPPANQAWISGHQLLAHLIKPLIEEPSDDPLVGGYLADGVRAVIGTVISSSWMSLETLIEDLWETSLNNFPIDLAIPVLESSISSEGGQSPKVKSISVTAFRKYGLDFSRCMGTVLIEQRKVDFRTLAGAKQAYKLAFSGRTTAIESAQGLGTFEAVRNVMAHKGGIIDEKFLSLTKNDKRFLNAQPNTPINLTGELACEFANLAIDCGVNLLRQVDSYLNEIASSGT